MYKTTLALNEIFWIKAFSPQSSIQIYQKVKCHSSSASSWWNVNIWWVVWPNPWDLYANCTPFTELRWICRLSKGKTFIHCLVTVGAALCYSLTTHTENPRRIRRLITCAPGTLWFFCSACKNCLNSYNSARWQVHRRRRRCWFLFLCGFRTTLAFQRYHIKVLREPSLSQQFDGWKDRWADRWLHR